MTSVLQQRPQFTDLSLLRTLLWMRCTPLVVTLYRTTELQVLNPPQPKVEMNLEHYPEACRAAATT
jgi:hypothetical protein